MIGSNEYTYTIRRITSWHTKLVKLASAVALVKQLAQ
jgi:hypothetical protein